MSFCTLEEAWGPNYTSFLTAASVSPDWLSNKEHSPTPPQQRTKESFQCNKPLGNIKQSDDNDLLLDYDEFNLPLSYDSPTPVDNSLNEYYKLIGSQTGGQVEHFNGNYSEEPQYGYDTRHDCDQYTNTRAKKHLKKCKRCRQLLRELLDELDPSNVVSTVNDNVVEPAKNGIKSLFPSHLKGYIDLIFFIAIGIFLIFVLDSFVRLGKAFAKRT